VIRKVLFVHVPKTAGSTLKSFFKSELDDFVVQANSVDQLAAGDPGVVRVRDMADVRRVLDTRGGLALHVDSSFDEIRRSTDFRSLADLLFEPEHHRYFEQFTILTMIRHPFRRFLSEFAFVRRMKVAQPGFLPDLNVSTVESFFERAHPNAMLHFLLERYSSRPREITDRDLERVTERIALYPIHVGIHERFDASIEYFARVLGRGFRASDLPSLNVGTKEPVVGGDLEAAFNERNRLDMALYEYATRRFDEVATRSTTD
jgi:hypothetical protein